VILDWVIARLDLEIADRPMGAIHLTWSIGRSLDRPIINGFTQSPITPSPNSHAICRSTIVNDADSLSDASSGST
jgi:hypothetical protein